MMMMSNTNSSLDHSNDHTRAKTAKPNDRQESVQMPCHRSHFGINLISRAGLPVRPLWPNSKKRCSVSSVLVDAIQVSTHPSTVDCHEDNDCCPQIDDATSVSTTDTVPAEKKVHFDLLQTEELEPNPLYLLDDETIEALWYSNDERKSMKLNRDNALCFGSDNEDWRDEMKSIIHFCNQAILRSTYEPEDLKERAKPVLSQYRGLEGHGFPQLLAMRRKHMDSVMMHIARIPKKMPEELRDRMVAARSLQYSRPSTILALILAQVDAAEVHQMLSHELQGERSDITSLVYR
jgi:hypothetical protein